MLMREVNLLILSKRNINLHEYDTNFIKETISDVCILLHHVLCLVRANLQFEHFLYSFLLARDIFRTWWYVRCTYERVSRFGECFFQNFYIEILRAKSIKLNFSAFISLFLSIIIENKYWSGLFTCSQDSVALH